jgi:Domain of unknown function (DUF5710)
MGREWLDVPFAEKDQAKAAGARWDQSARRWYAPRPGIAELVRWAALPDLPALLPGEDRSFGAGLFVDLVPESCWFTNARSCIAERDWERVRRLVVGRAGRRCEVEGCRQGEARERRVWLEAHERWEYQEGPGGRVQVLRRLVCLCTECHTATHFGLAGIRGVDHEARAHLAKVTGMSDTEAGRHIRAAFTLWAQRSAHPWELDLSILTRAGVALAPRPQSPRCRPRSPGSAPRAARDPQAAAAAGLAVDQHARSGGTSRAEVGDRSAGPASPRCSPVS